MTEALSRMAKIVLKDTVGAEDRGGVKWLSGEIVTELVDHGLCEIETVTNPDGSPGGGAYYYATRRGREVANTLPPLMELLRP